MGASHLNRKGRRCRIIWEFRGGGELRYWVLRGRSATGPYAVEALRALPGFGAETIVAPENAAGRDGWKSAKSFDELRALFLNPSPPPEGSEYGNGRISKRMLSDFITVTAIGSLLVGAVMLSSWLRGRMNGSKSLDGGRENRLLTVLAQENHAWDGRTQDAIFFAKNFQHKGWGYKVPFTYEDALNERFQEPNTLEQALIGFELLGIWAISKARGFPLQDSKELAQIFNSGDIRWSATQKNGPIYRIAFSHRKFFYPRDPTRLTFPFDVNLETKTLKPVTFRSVV